MLAAMKPSPHLTVIKRKTKSSSKPYGLSNPSKHLGAPSQHNQGSRKGKRAWRKNVDIVDLEEGLEELRAEERVTGTILQNKKDDELFQIDVKGFRKSLPQFSASQLTSTRILSQRSAVPAVFSRTTSAPASKRKAGGLTHNDKTRLLRIGKRMRKGPLNSYVDPTEFGAGSAILEVSEAVKASGRYDPWADTVEERKKAEVKDGMEMVKRVKVKRPALPHPRDIIELPAIAEPHQGTSYNPPVQAHTELLLKANEVEETRAIEADRLMEIKARFGKVTTVSGTGEDGISGMIVDEGLDDGVDAVTGEEAVPTKKIPERKTKQQRAKATRLRAEKQALVQKALKKHMFHTLSSTSIKSLRTSGLLKSTLASQRQVARQEKLKEKLRTGGLKGKRLGKHRVPEGDVDVQLGEDLSESLRGLKPEGNLFRDRFQSLQQRALVEPRVPVLPTKRKFKVKEYEKHAWKRFE